MFQPQDIVFLLGTAHAALRDDLLNALPAEQRHTCLMVANAVAIAQRYLKAGIESGVASDPLGSMPVMTHEALTNRCRRELQIANPKRL